MSALTPEEDISGESNLRAALRLSPHHAGPPHKKAPTSRPGLFLNQVIPRLVEDFEQAGCAHAAADAHGDDTVLGFAALTFHQDGAGAACARHAEWVTD